MIKHDITENTVFYNNDANIVCSSLKDVDFIYMDPPYDTNRTFTLDSKSDNTGFDDKWEDKYDEWLSALVCNLKKTLTKKGVLVLHISSENSFIAEKILREHFKNIEKIYWKRCHGKNTVKNKFGAVIDVLFVAYDNNKRIFNEIRIPIEEDSVWAFKNEDSVGKYSLGALKHDRTRKGYDYTIKHNEVEYKQDYGWKKTEEEVKKLIEDNRIHFVPSSKNMYVKVYKHEHRTSWWE